MCEFFSKEINRQKVASVLFIVGSIIFTCLPILDMANDGISTENSLSTVAGIMFVIGSILFYFTTTSQTTPPTIEMSEVVTHDQDSAL